MDRTPEETRLLRDRSGQIKPVTAIFSGASLSLVHIKLENGEILTTERWFYNFLYAKGNRNTRVAKKKAALDDDPDLFKYTPRAFTCGACSKTIVWARGNGDWYGFRWLDHKVKCQYMQQRYKDELGLTSVPPDDRRQQRVSVTVSPSTVRRAARQGSVSIDLAWRSHRRGLKSSRRTRRIKTRSMTANDLKRPIKARKLTTGFSLGRLIGRLASWLVPSLSRVNTTES